MMRWLVFGACVAVCACSGPAPSSDAGSDAAGTDAKSDADTGSSNTPECAEVSEAFVDAVRGMPRTCVTDADCLLVQRAGECDCDLAVTATSDVASFEAARAALDAAQCVNPFGCPGEQCRHRRLVDDGELYANCNLDGECEVVQLPSCPDYAAKAQGGLVLGGSCTQNSDCDVRNDLNACNCAEAVTGSFPFLARQAIYDIIAINNERCGISCSECPPPGTAVCANDDEGYMVCQMQ